MSLRLPLFITETNRIPVGIAMFLFSAAVYLASNHYGLFPPTSLPMTRLDLAIPFIPQTVWLYISEYAYFGVIYLGCRNFGNLNRYFYAYLTLQLLSVGIFCLWPTVYPRELFPLPDHLDPLTRFVFANLRVTDTAANCCPSLHVSSVLLSAFLFLDEQRERFPFFLTWGILICLSTLTTKQHYVIDIVAGAAMGAVAWFLFHRKVRYRAPAAGAQAKR